MMTPEMIPDEVVEAARVCDEFHRQDAAAICAMKES